MMDVCFSKRELSFLDDLMPESKKKKLDDAKKEAKEEEVTRRLGARAFYQQPGSHIVTFSFS